MASPSDPVEERVIVLSVVQQQLSKAETARRYQVSWRWVHTLVTRYQTGGWESVEPKSRRPHGNSRAVSTELRERILTLRRELQRSGLDLARSRSRLDLIMKGFGHQQPPRSVVFSPLRG